MKSQLLFIFIINLISCGDNGPNCPGDILLPINISPNNGLVHKVGDTVTVSSKFYKLIYDKKTDRYYNASNYNFRPIISLYSIDSSFDYNALSQVEVFTTFINSSNSDMHFLYHENQSDIVGNYTLENDSLNFTISLKLKQKGFFWFKIESLTSGDSHAQNNFQFNCRGREIKFILASSNGSNIQLLQQFRSNELNNWILSDSIGRFYEHAGYCFEVR